MDPLDDFAHEVAAHLMRIDPEVRVVNWAAGKEDYPLLPSIGRSGMTFEVGACPCGCVVGHWYTKSVQLVQAALDYVHTHNQSIQPDSKLEEASVSACGVWLISVQIPVFQHACNCDYPRDLEASDAVTALGHSITAFVHPAIDQRDFCELTEGDPIFLSLEGKDVLFKREKFALDAVDSTHPVYAFFINEAAYYEKGIGFMLATQLQHGFKWIVKP
eukprot:TRINITY_DN2678_c0_g1_i4.p1 TRINITY_DN2678_c0_g1~~TRINITY_DN2678_c0_g1_i4.p1  ORF type:complete len:217 (-),score=49.97 TRINITY_DN2678_c0_g1_i4:128-778(-)